MTTPSPPIQVEEDWPYLLAFLPEDLEESARREEALVRCRNVPNAEVLLRMALAYAVSDLSLKDVAAWAGGLGVATITGPGLFYRLRQAEGWLKHVLARVLDREALDRPAGWRLRVVDAMVINGPGATGTHWRAHVTVDPTTGGFQSVEITDAGGGEGCGRHSFRAGDVVLGDRACATARGIHAVRQNEAHVVVRLNPRTIRLYEPRRKRIDLGAHEPRVPRVGLYEMQVAVPVPPEKTTKSHKPWKTEKALAWLEARVVGARTRTGEVIWLLTTLPSEQLPAAEVLILYRLRWQIEMLFKRLKSLLHLDTLPSRQGPTARSWMLARFLAAALAQQLVDPNGALSPWGYNIHASGLHP